MTNSRKWLYHVLLATIALCSISTTQAESLMVAVASNFREPMQQIASNYESETGVKIVMSAASSGVLMAQIKAGAPFDLFLSADTARPQILENDGLIVEDSRHTYAVGELVLWTAKSQYSHNPLGKDVARIAIANPQHAPYGVAARCLLQKQQLWQQPTLNFVMANNIAQAFQFIYSGNAEAGLVAYSHVLAHDVPLSDIQHFDDPCVYIQQQLVIVKKSKNVAAAQEFTRYLLSASTQQLIESYGYQALDQGAKIVRD